MKQIQLFIICLILLLSSGMQAQMPAGRTKATIVADALAQLPADTQQKYNQTIADLVSTGEEGLLDLIGRMNPPGNKSNETVEDAISGWTHFVANDDVKRSVAANAFAKAPFLDFYKLTTDMSHAADMDNVVPFAQGLIAGIGVGLAR